MAKILIVDDIPANHDYLVTLLRYGKHELSEASDGAQGLERSGPIDPTNYLLLSVCPTLPLGADEDRSVDLKSRS
jgi:CheY-like chemotaxis protein